MLIQDLKYAIRTLVKSPGFTAVAVLCLSLGIGVNATIFSVVDGVILQPYPFPDGEQIIVPHSTSRKLRVTRGGVSFQNFEDLRDSNTTLASVAAFSGRSLTIADGAADPERYQGAAVSSGLFALLGIPPVLGRDFRPDDDRPGAAAVVILSDEVWRRRYNSDPNIVGHALAVKGRSGQVIEGR